MLGLRLEFDKQKFSSGPFQMTIIMEVTCMGTINYKAEYSKNYKNPIFIIKAPNIMIKYVQDLFNIDIT